MEAQQARIDLDPARELVGIRADTALASARVALARLLAEENPAYAQAAE
jgi:hypothetical protein